MTKTQTCSVPGCERSAMEDDSFNGCRQHRAVFDAQTEAEAWDLAWRILHPWVETAEPINSDELTKVMKEALDKAEMHVNLAQDDLERAAACGQPDRRALAGQQRPLRRSRCARRRRAGGAWK